MPEPLNKSDGPWKKLKDGSVVARSGRVVFFSTARFKRTVARGDCCVICGLSPRKKKFNDEHVLPRWLLKRYNLFGRRVTLPNGTDFRYDRYTIPCCVDCNSLMGRVLEEPIRKVLSGGHAAVCAYVTAGHGLNLFVWMAMIFVKTHLRDKMFRAERDQRSDAGTIAKAYDWATLHHIHTVARCFFTGATINREVVGTVFVLPAYMEEGAEVFDFADLYAAQVLLLRMHDVAVLAVFNDSCAVAPFLRSRLEKATGPFSTIQLREILVDAAACNLHLRNRPSYYSHIDRRRRSLRICANLSGRPEFFDTDLSLRGKLMVRAFEILRRDGVTFDGWESTEDFWSELRKGTPTFLYDREGKFITASAARKPPNAIASGERSSA